VSSLTIVEAPGFDQHVVLLGAEPVDLGIDGHVGHYLTPGA